MSSKGFNPYISVADDDVRHLAILNLLVKPIKLTLLLNPRSLEYACKVKTYWVNRCNLNATLEATSKKVVVLGGTPLWNVPHKTTSPLTKDLLYACII